MSNLGDTLEDALILGQGIERPFRCVVHDDSTASASVNVLKGVWYCHACHASGTVDGKRAPKVEELQAMLEPEKTCRVYPEAFAELYAGADYWHTRFEPWVCWYQGLGEDPFTGDATFPVHTAGGRFAGVGRRRVTITDEGEKKNTRYLYPRGWSAASSLFGSQGRYQPLPVLALVEGAADTTSVWEVGCPALGVYGAGLHLPQRELVARYNPKLILLGFDMDEAGERAVTRAFKDLSRMATLVRVKWPAKDPGDSPREARREALQRAVSRSGYGVEVVPRWDEFVAHQRSQYQRYVEDAA